VSFKRHFSRFLAADPERIHFAAHSHHFWPDVSFDAHARAWEDAALLADRKWEKVFGEIIPEAQGHVARTLRLSDPRTIAFAPNTHELVRRVLSCLPADRPPRVLTTSSEFHSFARQSARLEEDGLLIVERVPAEPFATLADRLAERAAQGTEHGPFDLVFFSHVLFDSSFVVDAERVVRAVPDGTLIVVDGYHAFLAVPVDLRAIEKRVFYMGGGYKYAMSGEGCCFLHAPPDQGLRPRDTGWFASFGTLAHTQKDRVPYAEGGARFLGATFDPTALYRFAAVMGLLEREGIDAARVRAHVRSLQHAFVRELAKHPRLPVSEADLVLPLSEDRRGQFLAFRTDDAQVVQKRLEAANVVTDARGDRLRFGFAIYHDEEDVVRGVERMAKVL
jgi:selenocysteine lyase/cysteine desulfurase